MNNETYRVSSDEFHESGEHLTYPTKEDQHADHDVGVLDAAGIQSVHADEEHI